MIAYDYKRMRMLARHEARYAPVVWEVHFASDVVADRDAIYVMAQPVCRWREGGMMRLRIERGIDRHCAARQLRQIADALESDHGQQLVTMGPRFTDGEMNDSLAYITGSDIQFRDG